MRKGGKNDVNVYGFGNKVISTKCYNWNCFCNDWSWNCIACKENNFLC